MFCSVEELGYSTHEFPEAPSDGIYVFPEGTPIGVDARRLLGVNKQIVEFEITSNRVDCFSVEGLAREAAITFQLPFTGVEVKPKALATEKTAERVEVLVEDEELCRRFTARLITDVKIGESPVWMRQRLRALGIRPINNIVDITNYVQLALGQPMHAYDLSYLAGGQIKVRAARDGEEIVTLDGEKHRLNKNNLVIADADKPVALAGVMGAENSEINDNTTSVLFEVANFEPMQVRRTAKQCGVRTESSSRFEKGLSPELVMRAMDYACYLVELLDCGNVAADVIDVCAPLPEKTKINYSAFNINKLLGLDLSEELINQILMELGLNLNKLDEGIWQAEIPYFRPDLQLKADLAEEVARIYGYNEIPAELSGQGEPTLGRRSKKQLLVQQLHRVLTSQNYFEAYTTPFTSPEVFDKLLLAEGCPLRQAIVIKNPLGVEQSLMRTNLLPHHLEVAQSNVAKGTSEGCIYEFGKTYHPKELLESVGEAEYDDTGLPEEREHIAGLCFGKQTSEQLFFKVKGLLEAIWHSLDLPSVTYRRCQYSYLHPGQAAELVDKKTGFVYGFVGTVHPQCRENFDLEANCVYFDLYLKPLVQEAKALAKIKALPKYPAVERDIALVVDRQVPVDAISDLIKREAKFLENIELFDVYQGDKIDPKQKSVAFSLSFRADDRTLTDEEIRPVMDNILTALAKQGINLRQ